MGQVYAIHEFNPVGSFERGGRCQDIPGRSKTSKKKERKGLGSDDEDAGPVIRDELISFASTVYRQEAVIISVSNLLHRGC